LRRRRPAEIVPFHPSGGNFSHPARVEFFGAVVNDDARLIDEALAGQAVAFGELVTKYQDRLYNALVHVVGSAEEARDVAQDAFVQAFLKLPTFQRTAAFYTWLYRIAFNLAVSRHRKRKPTASVERVREVAGQEPVAPDCAPSERLERQERVEQVQAALALLSEEHRAVLVLREFEGLSYETIHEILGIPLGTVRSQLHRARMELREHLKQVLQEET
jgi:RNA polymerase sigma-70 factor (ECF subfamily)